MITHGKNNDDDLHKSHKLDLTYHVKPMRSILMTVVLVHYMLISLHYVLVDLKIYSPVYIDEWFAPLHITKTTENKRTTMISPSVSTFAVERAGKTD